jgi:hypothetical protein
VGTLVVNPDPGEERDADNPRLVLIGVDIHAASFLEVSKSQPVVQYELAKGSLTGDTPEIGETQRIES